MKYDCGILLLVDMKNTLNEGHVVSGLIYQIKTNNRSILLADPKLIISGKVTDHLLTFECSH